MPAVLVVEVIFFSPFKRFETKTVKTAYPVWAGENRPQPQGLRASKSRKPLMLGVKTDGVPLGFKRGKRF